MLRRLTSPAWAVLEHAWYPLLLLLSTPWFLHRLGAEQYGYWMMLMATAGLGSILHAGTGAATIRAVSAEIGRGVGYGEQIRASVAIGLLGGGIMALLVLLVYWMGGDFLLGKMANDSHLVRLTGAVAALLIWLEQLDQVASSALKGAEQFGRAARLELVGRTMQVGSAALALWHWRSVEALYGALVAAAVMQLILKAVVARRALGLVDLRPSLRMMPEILHFARWGWLQGIGSVLFGVADRMLVGSLLGATSLTYYVIASQVAMQVHAVSAAGLSVIFPLVSRKLVGRGQVRLGPLAKVASSANLLVSGVIALGIFALAPVLLDWWIGAEAAQAVGAILPLLIAAYWVLALNIAPYFILLGMGRFRLVGMSALGAGFVGASAAFYSITYMGLAGAAWGRVAYALVTLLLFVPLVQRLLEERGNVRVAAAGVDQRVGHGPMP